MGKHFQRECEHDSLCPEPGRDKPYHKLLHADKKSNKNRNRSGKVNSTRYSSSV